MTVQEKGVQRRQQILAYIKTFRQQNGFSPTVREIATGVGLISSSTAQVHLETLKKQGKVCWVNRVPRTVQIIETEND